MPGASCGSPMWVQEPEHLGHLLLFFPGTLAESCMGNTTTTTCNCCPYGMSVSDESDMAQNVKDANLTSTNFEEEFTQVLGTHGQLSSNKEDLVKTPPSVTRGLQEENMPIRVSTDDRTCYLKPTFKIPPRSDRKAKNNHW